MFSEKEVFGIFDVIGKLVIDEIFIFYEEPQLFTCTNEIDHKYIILLTDMDDHQWLVVPISEARLSRMKSNQLSVKNAFIEPELKNLWKIQEYDSTLIINKIKIEEIPSCDLPDDDLFLDYKFDELMPCVDRNLIEVSVKEKRDIVDIVLNVSDSHIREIESEALGEVLSLTQQILYSLAAGKSNKKISKDIKDKTTMVICGTFAASFGVRFKSSGYSDLFGSTDVSPVIKMFSELLGSKDGEKDLKEVIQNYSKKTIVRYRQLMETLLQADTSLAIKAASPNKYCFDVDFTKDDIKRNLIILEKEIENDPDILTMYGTMVGINVASNTFVFKNMDNEKFSGKLSSNFKDVTFEVPQFVKATFEHRVTYNELIKDDKNSYTLVSIEDNRTTTDEN